MACGAEDGNPDIAKSMVKKGGGDPGMDLLNECLEILKTIKDSSPSGPPCEAEDALSFNQEILVLKGQKLDAEVVLFLKHHMEREQKYANDLLVAYSNVTSGPFAQPNAERHKVMRRCALRAWFQE